MREIRIGPAGQLAILVAIVAAISAAVAVQLPEIRRYLKVRSM